MTDGGIQAAIARSAWAATFIPPRFQDLGFDDLEAFRGNAPQGHVHAVHAAHGYAQDVRAGAAHPLVLFGPPGTGKTLLASCVWCMVVGAIADRIDHRDATAAGTADNAGWVGGAALPAIWRTMERDDGRSPEQAIHHLNSCQFMVIDDLDKCPGGENWGASLLALLDQRLALHTVPTVLTMNATPAEIAARYGSSGPPIVSRLARHGGVFIRLDEELEVDLARPCDQPGERHDERKTEQD